MTRVLRVRRSRRRWRGDSGLTVIELLLSLALMALLAAFIAGGFVFARRASLLDRTADRGEEADAAIQTLSGLLASAVPVATGDGAGPPVVRFDGNRASVSFVGLGAGHALRGGLHIIDIRVDDGRLVAKVRPTRTSEAKPAPGEAERRVVLLAGVRAADFGFFGSPKAQGAAAWRGDWSKAEILPRQISVRLALEGERPCPPELVVTLNQR